MEYAEQDLHTIIEEILDTLNNDGLFAIARLWLEKKRYNYIEEFYGDKHIAYVSKALLIDAMERGSLDLEATTFLCEKCHLNPGHIGKIGMDYVKATLFEYTVKHCNRSIIEYLVSQGMSLILTDHEGDEEPASFIYYCIKDRKEETWPERKDILECIYHLGITPDSSALWCALEVKDYSEQMIAWIYKRNPDIRKIDQGIVTSVIEHDIFNNNNQMELKRIGSILKARKDPLNVTARGKYSISVPIQSQIQKVEKLFKKYNGKFKFIS